MRDLKPECECGYTFDQVADIMASEPEGALERFQHWMNGQTMVLCTGTKYNHDTKEYEPACGGIAHGGVVFPWDVERFLDGRPIID